MLLFNSCGKMLVSESSSENANEHVYPDLSDQMIEGLDKFQTRY